MTQPQMEPVFSNPTEKRYVFPAYWGGMVVQSEPPAIHELLRRLRLEVGGIAAKKQAGGPMFPVKGAKELAQKLAQALCDLNMVAYPISQEVHHFDTDKIPSNANASGKPVFRTLSHVKTTVRIGAPDGSYVDAVGSGHGGDVDDKAGGKADTYAWKSALLKGLCIPEQDMLDTDDEEPSKRDEAKAKSAKAKGEVPAERPEGTTLEAVLTQISSANAEELERIKTGLTSKPPTIELSGSDRLKASQAYVARKKFLETQQPKGE
jgi:hypothetical protein